MDKLILIGIDAATWEIIDPLLKSGKLPTLTSLVQNGVRANLKSLPGYKSPALWTSIATGKSPEKNGVLFFSNLFLEIQRLNLKKDLSTSWLVSWPYYLGKKFSKDSRNPSTLTQKSKQTATYLMLKYGKLLEKLKIGGNYLITSSFRKEKAIWELLNDNGLKCGVVGWLVTWPADKIHGFIVSEKAIESSKILLYETSDKLKSQLEGGISYPYSLLDESKSLKRSPSDISNEEAEYFFNNLTEQDFSKIRNGKFDKSDRLNFFSYLYLSDKYSVDLGVELSKKHSPEFLTVYLPGLDGMQHIFWQYHQPEEFSFVEMPELEKFNQVIVNYYRFLDRQIAKLLEINKDATIVILSDHGTVSVNKKDYSVNSIRSGHHDESPDGILIMKGPGLKQGVKISDAHLYDIAPTILYLMGKPVDINMDGKVLEEAFSSPVKVSVKDYGKRESKGDSFYSKDEEEKVKERLNVLGYLD